MALSNTTNRVQTAALSGVSGGDIIATFNSRISTDADLKVYEVTTSATTLLTLNSDYTLSKTLSGSLITSASVVASASAVAEGKFADDSVIVVIRETDFQQSSNYEPNAILPADTLENDLDKLAMQTQQLKDDLTRSLRFSSTLTDAPDPNITLTAAERANKILGFNADGSEFAVTQEIGNYRSNWATGVVYSVRDIVKQSSASDTTTLNNIYICNTSHTASGGYLTQYDTAKWDLIVDAAAAGTSASAAATSASAAADDAADAQKLAINDEDSLYTLSDGATTGYSALHHAAKAQAAKTDAETAQGLAESAQAAAEGALTTIQGFYLGAQGSNPSVDGNGVAVTAGDWYFNTGDNTTRIYNGSSWDVIEALPQSLGTTDSPTFAGITAGTADINGGTIDGADITVGSGKTLHVSDGTLTLADNQISGDKIHSGTISDFASTGIDDNASSTALTIDADGATTIDVSSTSDALRVTQTGTGNALVVEDSTNPDSTPFVVNASGQVIIGATQAYTPVTGRFAPIEVNATSTGSDAVSYTKWSNTVNSLDLNLSRSRGSIGVQTIVNSNDVISNITFRGSDGNSFLPAANIAAVVDGTPGTNDMPGRLVFSTTADNASTPTERMRIDSSGHVIVPNGITLGTAVGTYNAANTLDHYEEGTWTPTLEFGGGSVGVTYSSRRYGGYIKIGKMVWASFFISPTNIGSSSGNCSISGLPFTSASIAPNYPIANGAVMLNGVSNSSNTVASIDHNKTKIDFYTTNTSGVRSLITNSDWANNDEIAATVCYEAA